MRPFLTLPPTIPALASLQPPILELLFFAFRYDVSAGSLEPALG